MVELGGGGEREGGGGSSVLRGVCEWSWEHSVCSRGGLFCVQDVSMVCVLHEREEVFNAEFSILGWD